MFVLTCFFSNAADNLHQTAKVVDAQSGEMKAELRGHDNVVETAQFFPPHVIPALKELIALKAGIPSMDSCMSD
jgi:platelet-activating factor acetylhydrolase IB subunit alpha